MNFVIEAILKRQYKSPPFSDGRKIALVLFGGNMIAVRSAAALAVMEKMGLNRAFDAIYTVSAGFPMAAYFLSGQLRFALPMYFNELASREFINFWRWWKIVDMNYLLRLMKKDYRLDINKIFSSSTDLFVRFRNIEKSKLEYFRVQDFSYEEFWKITAAAISLPFFSPGHVDFNGGKYMDTILFNDNLLMHLEKAVNSDATDILVLYNHQGQIKKDNSKNPRVYELYLNPEPKIGHFTRDKKKLLKTAQDMGDLVAAEFGFSELDFYKFL